MQPTTGVLLEDLVRLTSIQNTFSANNVEIPATVILYTDQPLPNEQSLHIAADNARRRSEGQQGVLIFGATRARFQHYKIDYRNTWREAFITGQKGVVRTPDKWGWHAPRFSIAGIGLVA